MMPIDKQSILLELIVIRWKRGDPDAFSDLVKNWERPLIYYLRRMLGEGQEEWDVLQEIWLRVFQGLGSLREPKAVRVWLYRIAHNSVMRHLREKYVDPPIEPTGDLSVTEIAVENQAEFSAEDAEVLHQALTRLPVVFREVLTLHFLEGMTVQNIAEVLGVPVGTIKSRLFHARRLLKAQFEREVQS